MQKINTANISRMQFRNILLLFEGLSTGEWKRQKASMKCKKNALCLVINRIRIDALMQTALQTCELMSEIIINPWAEPRAPHPQIQSRRLNQSDEIQWQEGTHRESAPQSTRRKIQTEPPRQRPAHYKKKGIMHNISIT